MPAKPLQKLAPDISLEHLLCEVTAMGFGTSILTWGYGREEATFSVRIEGTYRCEAYGGHSAKFSEWSSYIGAPATFRGCIDSVIAQFNAYVDKRLAPPAPPPAPAGQQEFPV